MSENDLKSNIDDNAENSDYDDFGNFEEAVITNCQNADDHNLDNQLNWPFSNFIEEEECSNSPTSSIDISGLNIDDIFNSLDMVNEIIKPELQNHLEIKQRYVKLWADLFHIEESHALKFLWNVSTAYSNLLDVLSSKNLISSSCDIPRKSSDTELNSQIQCNTSTNGDCLLNGSVSMVNSLSVPPALFDWKASGLSNPLTGSTMSTLSTILDCNFASTSSTNHDSLSMLESDLKAFGLLGTGINSTIKENSHQKLNDLQCPNKYNETYQWKLEEKDLSPHAKILYNRLPNLEHMLKSNFP